MISEDNFFKLGAQVQGLELVLKTVIALQLASRVKDEAGFTKAADEAQRVCQHLLDHIDSIAKASSGIDPSVSGLMLTEMRAAVARCFDQAGGQLNEVARLVLAVSDSPSSARN